MQLGSGCADRQVDTGGGEAARGGGGVPPPPGGAAGGAEASRPPWRWTLWAGGLFPAAGDLPLDGWGPILGGLLAVHAMAFAWWIFLLSRDAKRVKLDTKVH